MVACRPVDSLGALILLVRKQKRAGTTGGAERIFSRSEEHPPNAAPGVMGVREKQKYLALIPIGGGGRLIGGSLAFSHSLSFWHRSLRIILLPRWIPGLDWPSSWAPCLSK
jgi:hypothetical protein